MHTLDGKALGVIRLASGQVVLQVGAEHHPLGLDAAHWLGRALIEAQADRPNADIVRSVITRDRQMLTVERDLARGGARVVMPGGAALEFTTEHAGELALELLRTAAGLADELCFAAWVSGAWLSDRRHKGDLEAAFVAAVRTAAPRSAKQQRAIVLRVLELLGGAAPGHELTGAPAALRIDDDTELGAIDDLVDALAELQIPEAFVRGMGEAALGHPATEQSAAQIELYRAGRTLAEAIVGLARARE